ncbi:MAG: ATP-binding protein [Kofleriaceae bacterium]
MSDDAVIAVWTESERDAEISLQLLQRHGLQASTFGDFDRFVAALPDAGCALITAESLTAQRRTQLGAALAHQPPWSDLPIVLFAPRGADRESDAQHATELLGNVTVLERPVRARTLLSAVVAALRGRRRQFQAREAIRRRDQFLAMLGHELRNPLSAILLALELLNSVSGSVGTKQRTIIDRQVRHLARLVDDLLDVARVTSGKITLQRGTIDINDVLKRCVQGAELIAANHSMVLSADLHDAPLPVCGDLVRLEEVFNNLINNALKYSPPGGRIQIVSRRAGDHVAVDVIDNGIGMEPELLANVFELFAQAERSLDRSQGGLGIGLTLVRSLVELHHGTVEAHSGGLGLGSTFTVQLPLVSQLPAAVGPTRARDAAANVGLRVTVIEDNLDLLEMTKDLLELQGCSVITASDGREGLARLLDEHCDVAFIDIGLPELDGLAVAQQVTRQLSARPYLIAITGYGQDQDRARALAAGFDDHVVKPVSLEVLKRVLEDSRRKRPPARKLRSVP